MASFSLLYFERQRLLSFSSLLSSCDSYLGADQTFDLPTISVAVGEDSDSDEDDSDEEMSADDDAPPAADGDVAMSE